MQRIGDDSSALQTEGDAGHRCTCLRARPGPPPGFGLLQEPPAAKCPSPCGRLLPLWDEVKVKQLSCHPLVARALAVGTIVAVELVAEEATPSGQASPTSGAPHGSATQTQQQPAYVKGGLAVEVARRLRDRHMVYCRPLGPVVYIMVPPTSDRRRCETLIEALSSVLGDLAGEGQREATGEEGVVV